MNRLKDMLHEEAGWFVEAMLARLQGATIEDLMGAESAPQPRRTSSRKGSKYTVAGVHTSPKAGKTAGGRLARRSKEEILASAAMVASHLKGTDGLRAEQIQKELGLDKRESPRILREGVAAGILKKKGQRRSTVYSVGSSKAKASPAKTVKKAKAKALKTRAQARKKPAAKKPAKKAPKAKKPLVRKPARLRKPKAKKVASAAKGPTTKVVAEAAKVSKLAGG